MQEHIKTCAVKADCERPIALCRHDQPAAPRSAKQYRLRVQHIYETLQDDSEERRTEAAGVLRTLVEDIILTPVNGKIEIDVQGDLAGILTLSVKKDGLLLLHLEGRISTTGLV